MVPDARTRPMFDTTCGSLFRDIQLVWDEVGESEETRDKMLMQLEEECLEVYRRKLDQAKSTRANLQQCLVDLETDIARIKSSLGERDAAIERHPGTLRQQLAFQTSYLENLRQRKHERARQLQELKLQIYKERCEISGISPDDPPVFSPLNEDDLSFQRLEKYQAELLALQTEKNDRLLQVSEYLNRVHHLSSVLEVDFFEVVHEVHPSLSESGGRLSKSISNKTLESLPNVIKSLEEEKRHRMQKLQDLAMSLIHLWTLMDTTAEEQQMFRHVTCQLGASEDEIVAPGALAPHVIKEAEIEVQRLIQLKASRIKEFVLKKRTELEDIYRRAHMESDSSSSQETMTVLVDSGVVDPSEILASIEEQIGNAKEEAFSRREILEKMEKWLAACEEESWLEEYNKDDNRYNASRAAYINLKRAEKARITVGKIPALVESLIAKTRAWEEERGKLFLYDGVRLLAMLGEYNLLREEKEEERRRLRDRRRLQEQVISEQETLLISRSNVNKPNVRKGQGGAGLRSSNGIASPANSRRSSVGGAISQPTLLNSLTRSTLGPPSIRESRKDQVCSAERCMNNETPNDDSNSEATPVSGANSNSLQAEDGGLNNGNHQLSPKKLVILSLKNTAPAAAIAITEEHHRYHQHQFVKHETEEYSFEELRAALPRYCSNMCAATTLTPN